MLGTSKKDAFIMLIIIPGKLCLKEDITSRFIFVHHDYLDDEIYYDYYGRFYLR